MVSPAIENSQIVPYKSLRFAVRFVQLAQPLFDPGNLQAPLAGSVHSQGIPLRQRDQGREDSQILLRGGRIRTQLLFQYVLSMLQNPAVGLRSQRKRHVEILDQESSAPINELELAVVKSVAVEAAEHGQKDFVIERKRRRMPIDIEIGCVSGCGTILKDIHPPWIFRARSHVIRNNVQQQAHALFLQLRLEGLKLLFVAQLAVNPQWIRDVVPVLAA